MDETITIVGNLEATVALTIFATVKITLLFFAVMHTFIFLRNACILAGVIARNSTTDFAPKLIYIPTTLWVVFYIVCNLSQYIA